MYEPKPLKRFGQNYLKDYQTILKIAREFDPQPDQSVIEIGPGTGALTKEIYNKVEKLTAIEVDFRVIENLANTYPTVHFINADFLETDLIKIFSAKKRHRVIGNIPYNITSPIIFKLIEHRKFISDAMFMVQYEVAKRITAQKRTKDYGILSVILNSLAEVKFCFKIPPEVFYPKPKVFSAIIQISFNKEFPADIDEKMFFKVVKASFGNRRKTLKNSISNTDFKDKISGLDFDFTRRAEELTVEDYFTLTRLIASN